MSKVLSLQMLPTTTALTEAELPPHSQNGWCSDISWAYCTTFC